MIRPTLLTSPALLTLPSECRYDCYDASLPCNSGTTPLHLAAMKVWLCAVTPSFASAEPHVPKGQITQPSPPRLLPCPPNPQHARMHAGSLRHRMHCLPLLLPSSITSPLLPPCMQGHRGVAVAIMAAYLNACQRQRKAAAAEAAAAVGGTAAVAVGGGTAVAVGGGTAAAAGGNSRRLSASGASLVAGAGARAATGVEQGRTWCGGGSS